MLEIAPEKVAHIIVRAREYDGKVAAWDDDGAKSDEDDADSILEERASDATRSELAEFIANLNEDEQIHLVALMWVGRGSFLPEEFSEALSTARTERVNKTEDYLLGVPLLADFLEEGLDKLGFAVEDAESGIL
ncbi:MAG: DUF3775 domain-containing protein [Hyphomicrobiaceae bacterium]|nr:DUF3775 domain-containing protein [Hyphomicrobiaceae bacterium]